VRVFYTRISFFLFILFFFLSLGCTQIDEREKLLEKALDALASTDPDSGSGDSSSGGGGSTSLQASSATGAGGRSLAVISEDGATPSSDTGGGGATSVVAAIREQLQRLREAKGAPAGFSEAFKQVKWCIFSFLALFL